MNKSHENGGFIGGHTSELTSAGHLCDSFSRPELGIKLKRLPLL